jgi:hypothetical protein
MLRGRFGHVVGGVGIALPYRLGGAGGGVLGRLQLHLGVQLGPTKTTQAERYKEPSSRDKHPDGAPGIPRGAAPRLVVYQRYGSGTVRAVGSAGRWLRRRWSAARFVEAEDQFWVTGTPGALEL